MKQAYNISVNFFKATISLLVSPIKSKPRCRRCAGEVDLKTEYCDDCVDRRSRFLKEIIF